MIANRNLDLLFMIDNSSSMRLSQANLLTNFPTFMNVLKDLPGGLPNIHVAVVSSDMGAGDGIVIRLRRRRRQRRLPVRAARDLHVDDAAAPARRSSPTSAAPPNYTAADIATVFSCIAALGEAGCGFEHQFASMLRALGADGMPAPPENQGFLRADALLAIVMLTNEDDCSARRGRPPLRHVREHATRVAARPARRTSAATSSATSATAQRPPRDGAERAT